MYASGGNGLVLTNSSEAVRLISMAANGGFAQASRTAASNDWFIMMVSTRYIDCFEVLARFFLGSYLILRGKNSAPHGF